LRLTEDLPHCMSCDLITAGKDEAMKIQIAGEHIARVINLSQSKRKVEDYSIKIVNNQAYFTLIKGE
jgi:hypothetical protein